MLRIASSGITEYSSALLGCRAKQSRDLGEQHASRTLSTLESDCMLRGVRGKYERAKLMCVFQQSIRSYEYIGLEGTRPFSNDPII
jgi:hypothetical protein